MGSQVWGAALAGEPGQEPLVWAGRDALGMAVHREGVLWQSRSPNI